MWQQQCDTQPDCPVGTVCLHPSALGDGEVLARLQVSDTAGHNYGTLGCNNAVRCGCAQGAVLCSRFCWTTGGTGTSLVTERLVAEMGLPGAAVCTNMADDACTYPAPYWSPFHDHGCVQRAARIHH